MVDYFPIQKVNSFKKISNFLNNHAILLLAIATFILSYVNYRQTVNYSNKEFERKNQEIKDQDIKYFRDRLDFAIRVNYWMNNGIVFNNNISKIESGKISLEKYAEYVPFSDNISKDHLFFSLYSIYKKYPNEMSIYDSLILSNLSVSTRPKESHEIRFQAYIKALIDKNENTLAAASAKLYYAHDVHFGYFNLKSNPNLAAHITRDAVSSIGDSNDYQINSIKLQLLFVQASNMGIIKNKSECSNFANLSLSTMNNMIARNLQFNDNYRKTIPKLLKNCAKIP